MDDNPEGGTLAGNQGIEIMIDNLENLCFKTKTICRKMVYCTTIRGMNLTK